VEEPVAHVALVLPVLHPGGAERVVAELAQRLPAEGFRTSVVCLEDETAVVGAELREHGVDVTGLRISRFRTLAAAKALAQYCSDTLRHGGPHRRLILHSHLHHANLATRLCLRRLLPTERAGVRVVSTVHIVERRFRPWQFLLDRLTAQHAEAEVCVSPAVARYQQHRTGLPESFFHVIENGVDLARFRPAATGNSRGETKQAGLCDVVSVGRLNRQKDFETLLRAWQVVEQRHHRARLTIAGEGPQRQRLQRLIDALQLRRAVLAGFVSDIPRLLRDADLYVQSSLWEGQPLAVIEAMASRLPIVVTDGDGLPETVDNGRTGLVVPRSDPPGLAGAILHFLNDPAQARTCAAAAHDAAIRRFSVTRMVTEYAELYRRLLQRQGR
jgi:glycosyltransferase involved in cell wall biosynthesis